MDYSGRPPRSRRRGAIAGELRAADHQSSAEVAGIPAPAPFHNPAHTSNCLNATSTRKGSRMKYNTLAHTGLLVSEICLRCPGRQLIP